MTVFILGVIILGLFCFGDTTTTKRWPIVNAVDKKIVSNIGDHRINHFHMGLDISASTASVRSYSKTFLYLYRWYDTDWKWFVLVDHQRNDTMHVISGSQYIHMLSINDTLANDEIYVDKNLANNTSFLNDHLHFDYYTDTADTASWGEAVNPMTQDSLKPLDNYPPLLDKIYVDGSLMGSASISCLNFLQLHFDSLYSDTTGGIPAKTFKKLKLHTTLDNDLDDPHIIISDSCKVKFIVHGYDNFSYTTDRGAPFELGLYLDKNIIDCVQDHYKFNFDFIDYESHEQEEDIYHIEPPCSTIQLTDAQFYRLYNWDVNGDSLPSCIVSQDTLKTENLDEGMHRIRVVAKDFHNNITQVDVHFYVRLSNWVDFCRGYK